MAKYFSMVWRKDQISEEKVIELLKKVNFTPLEKYKNQATPFKVRCNTCNEEVKTRIGKIIKGGQPRCSCIAYKKYNKEETMTLLRERSLKSIEEYPGNTHKPWRMVCLNCNNIIAPTLKSIRTGQGCKFCGGGTKKYDETIGRVYLLHNIDAKILKIGITNQFGLRLKKYTKDWILIRYIELNTGKLAYELEKEILKIWRVDMGLKIALTQESKLLKKVAGGYTETASDEGLNPAIKRIDKWVSRNKAKNLLN